jgi:Leucine-rich repeat (LRR) protein
MISKWIAKESSMHQINRDYRWHPKKKIVSIITKCTNLIQLYKFENIISKWIAKESSMHQINRDYRWHPKKTIVSIITKCTNLIQLYKFENMISKWIAKESSIVKKKNWELNKLKIFELIIFINVNWSKDKHNVVLKHSFWSKVWTW